MSKLKLLQLCLLLAATSSVAMAQPVKVTIDTDAAIGTINPNIYGQFVEHLGSGIYGGIWVGPDSEIPNQDGYRLDVLQALQELDVPLMRWPGGCFADRYQWRDGIGPRDERPARLNSSWGGVIETNAFGTHEFFNLAEILGAQTYLNFNVATGTPQEAVEWLEYITSDSASSLAEERRDNGRDEPWTVDYFSIGNETWGCGGNMTPDYYASLYAQFATFLSVPGKSPKRIISGSYGDNIDYSKAILENAAVVDRAEGISVHYYTLPTGDWDKKGAATGFPEAEWFSTIERTLNIENIINEQLAMIDALETENEFKLYVDEWGMWTDQEEGSADSSLYQQNSLRDAVVAALNLNIFHGHAARIEMTNIAQMVNVLQAMILTDEKRMLLTPTYHVFHMYKPFQDATALPVSFTAPDYEFEGKSVPALSVSAARTGDGELYLALVNADPHDAIDVFPDIGNGTVSASGMILTADATDAHNTFDKPAAVKPQPVSFVTERNLPISLPPKSVTVLKLASAKK